MLNAAPNSNSGSDSDSSLGSWTMVDDEPSPQILPIESMEDAPVKNQRDPKIEIVNEVEMKPTLDAAEFQVIDQQPRLKKHDDGFLTFDEFLHERLMDHDYEQAEKAEKVRKRFIKSRRFSVANDRSKGPKIGISVMIAIVLTLTAFATLCSTLSQPNVPHNNHQNNHNIKKDANKFERNFFGPINKETYRNHREQMRKSLEELKLLQDFKLNGTRNFTQDGHCPAPLKPLNTNKIEEPVPTLPKLPIVRRSEQIAKKLMLAEQSDSAKTKKVPSNNWSFLHKILFDTNLHAIISLIVTNIYLFTILFDISRQHNLKCDNPDEKTLDEIVIDCYKKEDESITRRKLFRQLPFWRHKIDQGRGSKKQKAAKTVAKKLSQPKVEKENAEKISNVFIFSAEPSSTALVAAKPEKRVYNMVQQIESGKSECQRRFDELDLYQMKFETLKQNQRNRIKMLKQKFQNEIAFIKSTENESKQRAERIQQTSQKFINKLKGNREKYLQQMKKAKELRTRETALRKMDVATGIYEVSIPTTYNFPDYVVNKENNVEMNTNQQKKRIDRKINATTSN